jgi:hypothetical protein
MARNLEQIAEELSRACRREKGPRFVAQAYRAEVKADVIFAATRFVGRSVTAAARWIQARFASAGPRKQLPVRGA